MRHAVLAAALVLLLSSPALAQKDVQAVIDRAIQAHGGAANLSRLKARQCKTRGTVYRGGPLPFTQEIAAQPPQQIKEVTQIQAPGGPATVVTFLNGDSGRLEINGQNQAVDDGMLNELKESAYLAQLVRLTGLKGKEHRLTGLGESVVSGRPAVGIRVATSGHRDVSLYFDQEFGVLAKSERTVIDLRTKQGQREEAIYSDWKVVDGLVTPTKVTVLRDGYKFSEVEVTEIHFLEKLDDKVFAQR